VRFARSDKRWEHDMTDLFEQRLRQAAQSLPVPEAPAGLIDRVIAERAAGERYLVRLSTSRSRKSRWLYAGLIAAGLFAVGIVLTSRTKQHEASVGVDAPSSVARLFTSTGVAPTEAFAQAPPESPGAPPLTNVDASSLGGRHFQYRIQFVDTTGRVTPDGDGEIQISAAQYGTTPAWRIHHIARMAPGGQPRVEEETLYVSRQDLRPLWRVVRQTPYLRYSHISIRQRFVGDSVLGIMSTNTVRRPIAQSLPTTFAPYLFDAIAPVALSGVPLSREWRASVSIVGWAVMPNDIFVPVTLRVIGEETLTIGSKTFDCWKVAIVTRTERRIEWVRKSDGIALRSLDDGTRGPKGRREFVLVNP
jgi:hypothetical protein